MKMSTMMAPLGVVVLAMGLVLGCGGKDDDGKEKEKAKAAQGAVGLEDPTNDKVVADAARAAILCEWSPTGGLKYDCPAHKTWKEASFIKEGAADPTLTTMLVDAREPVRWLAAEALASQGKAYTKNAALAGKVVAAAQAEKSPFAGASLGRAVAKIDLAATGQQPAAEAMVKTHPVMPLRQAMAQHMLWSNKQLYDLTLQLARTDAVPEVRKAALSAPWTGTPSGREKDTCAMFLEKVDDAAPEVGGEAAYLCGFWSRDGGCKAQWDALLGKIEARARAGTVKSPQMASALSYFHGQKAASAAQKTRAVSIAKALVENAANAGIARGNALRFIGEVDDGAKAYAGRWLSDKEFFVKNTAKDIVEGKIKRK
jgi:hypothetical protein